MKTKVAERFNCFFTTIAQSLVDKLPPPTGRFGLAHLTQFYQSKGVTENMFGLTSTTPEEVHDVLQNISTGKVTGLDGLPPRIIKDSSSVIAAPLAHIINLSIMSGAIPDDLK